MIQIATIETSKADRLMKALCNHFARKITSTYQDDKGYIEFGDGKCEIIATSSAMVLQVSAESAESLARVEHVVGEHLLRFTPDDEIEIKWQNKGQG